MSLLLAGVKAAPPAANATATSAFQGYPGEAYPGEPTYPGGTSHVIEVRVAPPAASATASAPTPIPEVRLLPPAGSTTASAPTPVPQVKVLPPAALVNTSAPTPVPEVRMLSPPCTANASAPVPNLIISATVTPPAASVTASASLPTPKITLFGHWSVLPNGDFENGTTNSWVIGTDFGPVLPDTFNVVGDWSAHGSKAGRAVITGGDDYTDFVSPGEMLAGAPVGGATHGAARAHVKVTNSNLGASGVTIYLFEWDASGALIHYTFSPQPGWFTEASDDGLDVTLVVPRQTFAPGAAYAGLVLEAYVPTGNTLEFRFDAAELFLGDANLTLPSSTFVGHGLDVSAPTPVPEVRVLPPAATTNASAPTPSLRIDTTQVAPVATTNASAPTPVPEVRLLPPAELTNASASTPVPEVRVLSPAGSFTASGLASVPEVRVLPPAGLANASAPTPTLPQGAILAPAGVVTASAPTPTISSSLSATVFATPCVATASAPIPGFTSLQSLNSGYLHTVSTDQNLSLETGSIATTRTVIATELAVPSVTVGVENNIQTVSVTTTQIEAATNADDTIDLFTTTIPQDLSLTSEGDITLYIVLQP